MSIPPPDPSSTDVRMRGFLHRTTVEAALNWVDSVIPELTSLPAENLSLFDAASRVLATDITSRTNVPGFARSMMDGYALRAEETHGATSYNMLSLQIIGTCLPGTSFPGHVAAGQAVRIMTGAPLPAGADAVLPVENTDVDGHSMLATGEVSAGKNVARWVKMSEWATLSCLRDGFCGHRILG